MGSVNLNGRHHHFVSAHQLAIDGHSKRDCPEGFPDGQIHVIHAEDGENTESLVGDIFWKRDRGWLNEAALANETLIFDRVTDKVWRKNENVQCRPLRLFGRAEFDRYMKGMRRNTCTSQLKT
jgi:hypothetical protein